MVRFPETTKTKGGKTCLARIMGFSRYTDIGMLTYKHLEMESYNKADITKMRDDTLYAVFNCQITSSIKSWKRPSFTSSP